VAALGSWRHLVSQWRRVVETLRHGSGGTGTGRGAELLAVAVDGSWQGKGAGQSLVNAFLAEVSRRGGDAAHVVVGAENAVAVALYRRAGFEDVERFELHAGTESLLMQWDRNSPT
jgi:ribosomal protein S18 acetylase RimI-like enzyme